MSDSLRLYTTEYSMPAIIKTPSTILRISVSVNPKMISTSKRAINNSPKSRLVMFQSIYRSNYLNLHIDYRSKCVKRYRKKE